MGYVIIIMEIYIKDNIKKVKRKDMEYLYFQMVIHMKVNGKMVKKMDME